jgi:hypothetical protein
MLHVTMGYDVGGARFVEFSSRKINPVPTGFILPSKKSDPNAHQPSRNFTGRDQQREQQSPELWCD